jgi:hypothetical protein
VDLEEGPWASVNPSRNHHVTQTLAPAWTRHGCEDVLLSGARSPDGEAGRGKPELARDYRETKADTASPPPSAQGPGIFAITRLMSH